VSLTLDLQVERQYQRRTAGKLGAPDQVGDEPAILHHVQLEPERPGRGRRNILDGTDAHGGQRERHAETLCGACGEDLAVRILHAGQAGRREGDRHRDRLPDHRGGEIADAEIDGHALAKMHLGEVVRVRAVRRFGP
jgi:hypothetical protein